MLASRLRKLFALYQRRKRLVLTVGGILAVLFAVAGWKVHDHVENNPRFCTSCHLMTGPFSRWEKSPHREVNCHTCHPGNIRENLHQLWFQLTEQPKEIRKHAHVDPKVCKRCHQSNDRRWKQIGASAGHRVHVDRQGITCVRCHAPSVHVFVPMTGVCQSCHQEIKVKVGGMEHFDCLNCHDYSGKQASLMPTAMACLSCHRTPGGKGTADGGPGVRRPAPPDHLPGGVHGNIPCGECHLPHGQVTRLEPSTASSQPRRRVLGAKTTRECRDCHATAWEQTLASSTSGHQECGTCHAPHRDRSEARATCDRCHQDRATHKGKHGSCADCHTPHDWRQVRAERCQGCHQAEVSRVASARGPHTDCVSCHANARPAGKAGGTARVKAAALAVPALTRAASLSCAGCHEDAARAVVKGPAMHRRCQGCHLKHEEQHVTVAVCAKCHAKQAAATAGAKVASHQKCQKCHGVHPAKKQAAIAGCASCHAAEAQRAGRANPTHRDCTSCHEAHDPSRGASVAGKKSAAAACANCHDDKAQGLAQVKGSHSDCASCHAKHGPPKAAALVACANCHAQGKTTGPLVAKHGGCAKCHDVHSASPRKVVCTRCHGAQAKKVAAAPEEHRTCANCHDAHGTAGPTSKCVDCHDAEVARLKARKNENHADCASCHDAHAPKGDPSKACAGCHDEKAAGLQARGPHSSCRSCHQPHGKRATPRACADCHTQQKLGGLHRGRAHGRCASCHETHKVTADVGRGRCETCHSDRKAHNPGAACASCHLFR